jgi:hypothetical protein
MTPFLLILILIARPDDPARDRGADRCRVPVSHHLDIGAGVRRRWRSAVAPSQRG